MRTTSTNYKTKILEASRNFQCRVTIGNVVLTNDDIVDIILDTLQPSDGFMIGSTASQALDLTIINNGNTIYSTNQVKVEIGLNTGTVIEYILMGYYNIDEVVKTDYTTKFTCYDNMIKFETPYITRYGDTPTLQQIINDLYLITKVQFTGILPSYTVKKLEGFTCREVLSYVASICGGNAVINRDGWFTIVYPTDTGRTITGNNYIDFKREDIPYKIGTITCQNGEDSIINKGTLGTDSMELSFENPWVTDSILTDIYNKLNGFTYLGYTMKWQGDLSLDIGDIITITDVKGVVRNVPILSQKLTYTGGLTSEIGAKGESKNKNSFNSSGSTSKQVQRVATKLLLAEEAIINKANIQDLSAVSLRTKTLETKTANIETALIDKANVEDLNVTNANIANLVAVDVSINNLLAAKATIIDLSAAKVRIGTLESSTADIGTIRSNLATITTLVNGNLTSDNIQSLVLTSEKVTVANGFIKNAMIENLDVSKINAGDISTNKFRIVSDSGKMVIADNTIQINDTNRTRVQIGKDASNDYNMYVWDNAGKLMFDATGLKADGIKSKIIRDDMISDTANINGSKININSLVTELNKDTNTSVIKASKVNIDLTGQTLEVAFNTLKSNVEDVDSKTESNTTSINVEKGRINTLISDSTIIQGDVTTLSDNYSSLSQTVNGINSTVGSHTTSITTLNTNVGTAQTAANNANTLAGSKAKVFTTTPTTPYKIGDIWAGGPSGELMKCKTTRTTGNYSAGDWEKASKYTDDTKANAVEGNLNSLTGTVTTVQNKQATLEQNLDGFKTTVSSTYSTKTDLSTTNGNVTSLTTRMSSAESSITQHTNSIALKVATTDFNTYKTTNNTAVASKASQTDLNITNGNVTSLTTRMESAESSINIQTDQINLKVSQSDIDTSINSIEIGGRNLLTSSDFEKHVSDGFTVNTNVTISLSTDFYYQGSQSFKIVYTGPNGAVRKEITGDYLNMCKGKEVSFSFKIKGNGSSIGKNIVATILNSDATKKDSEFLTLTANWQTMYVTTTIPANATYFRLYIGFGSLVSGDTVYIDCAKLELGNKITDWTPAPEDIDQKIIDVSTSTDTKISTAKTEIKQTTDSIALNVTSLQGTTNTLTTQMGNKVETSEYNTTKNTVAAHAIKLTGITSTVSASISTAKTEAINSANGTTNTKLESYSTTTQMNTAITQSATSITTAVSNTYLSKQSASDTYGTKTDIANIYATKSLVTQTDTAWKASFSSSGGYNLINNGCFTHGLTSWSAWLTGATATPVASASGYGHAAEITTTGSNQGILQIITGLEVGKQYTLSCYVYNVGTSRCTLMSVCNNVYTTATSTKTATWEWLEITFVAGASNASIYLGKSNEGAIGKSYMTAVMVQRGTIRSAWSPNANELKNGNTTINADGVTINNGALIVKNNNNTVIIDGQSDMHKIVATGSVQRTFTGAKGETIKITIPHGLNYRPCHSVYHFDGGVYTTAVAQLLPKYDIYVDLETRITKMYNSYSAHVNNTDLIIKCEDYLGGFEDTFTIKYYIYKEVAI